MSEKFQSTHIRLTEKQYNQLRRESFETGKSQSEIIREALEMRWAQAKRKGGVIMTGEVYKVLVVNGKQVKCIDETDGFSLEIAGLKYHVYADGDGSTHVDQCFADGTKEYIGKVNDKWTADEEEAALFILS